MDQGAPLLESGAVRAGNPPSVFFFWLWEADHNHHFPTTSVDITAGLTGFTSLCRMRSMPTHVVAADCANFASALWMRKGLARGFTVFPFPFDWLQAHILLLAVDIIHALFFISPAVRSPFLPFSFQAWLVPKLLQDTHLAMVVRLAEVLRRREEVMRLAHPASLALTGPPTPSPARQPRQWPNCGARNSRHRHRRRHAGLLCQTRGRC